MPFRPTEFRARRIHLIDVENLLGGTRFDFAQVIGLEDRYQARVAVDDRDFVVIASSHAAAEAAWFGWSPARRLVRSGPDGADRALVDVIEGEDLAGRFGHVVIGSGDGIFAEPAARLQSLGCEVSVVARRPGTVARRLAFAVRDIIYVEAGDEMSAAELRLVA